MTTTQSTTTQNNKGKTMKFNNIAEIIKYNKSIGGHWFDKDTMEFFNSITEEGVYGEDGRIFITSEKFDYINTEGVDLSEPRKWTVRFVEDNGFIETISNFTQFDNLEEAKVWVEEYLSNERV